MKLERLLEEVIESQGIFNTPEFVKIKHVEWSNDNGDDLHKATVLFFDELCGPKYMEITLKQIDYMDEETKTEYAERV